MAWCMGEECAHKDVAQLGDEGDGLDGERARHLGLGGLRFLGRLCRLLLLRQLFWQAQLPPPLPPILLCASRQAHLITSMLVLARQWQRTASGPLCFPSGVSVKHVPKLNTEGQPTGPCRPGIFTSQSSTAGTQAIHRRGHMI